MNRERLDGWVRCAPRPNYMMNEYGDGIKCTVLLNFG